MSDVLTQLDAVLAERKASADPSASYVAQLHHKGLNKILEKVGEEATEAILAAKDAEQSGDLKDTVYETADLWFHSLVMLSHLGVDSRAVIDELARRFDLSRFGRESVANKKLNDISRYCYGYRWHQHLATSYYSCHRFTVIWY